jgi:hypothetical protein
VAIAAKGPNPPSVDVMKVSNLLETMAIGYRAIYAHGMHLKMRVAKLLKVTCDNGVASGCIHNSRSQTKRNKCLIFEFLCHICLIKSSNESIW